MADSKSAEIRIVKKKKGGHGGHHGGAWKVAYADFVTAMMAFFLVMWIVGLSSNIKESVAGYFQDPVAFMEAVRAGNAPFAVSELMDGTGKEQEKQEKSVPGGDSASLSRTQKKIEEIITQTPSFKELKTHIEVKVTKDGLRIDLMDGRESLFFDAGSAKVKPATADLLTKVAKELKALPNKVILEGHTDSRPLSKRADYSNWELSSDRANSARRIMNLSGLRDQQIAQVRGYAATQPRDPKHPEHFSNRRISIIVESAEATIKRKIDAQRAETSAPATPDIKPHISHH